MKIALIQLNPLIGDFAYNIAKISRWVKKARDQGCALAILPELAVSGYPPQDLLTREAFLIDHEAAVQNLVAGIKGIGVICGVITRHTPDVGKPLHNSALLFEDGEILFTSQKRLLPTYDVFDEHRYFESGSLSKPFFYKGLNLGITICEDIWNDKNLFARQLYHVDPLNELAAAGGCVLDLLINIAASPFSMGKAKIKQQIFTNICSRYKLPLVYVNQVGGHDSLIFDGESALFDKSGTPVVRAKRFTEDMVIFNTTSCYGDLPSAITETYVDCEIAHIYDALVLGVHDYVKKCGFSRVVIGLSGGIDSALTAAIAVKALGAANVLGVTMPSPYSSVASVDDARKLAQNLHILFEVIPINHIFRVNLETMSPFLGEFTLDVTEQNIQARIRGNLLMALANKQRRLVLSTGNKSEMAVGYCTLYGDMSGGLAVIADVPKLMVYKLSQYINDNSDEQIIPQNSINKPPSAELAPNQQDQDDLPPYELLDPILAAYLEENLSIKEIVETGFAQSMVEDIVWRVRKNEYKRKQAPIGLKVTSKAFGHGRRYPVAENYRERC